MRKIMARKSYRMGMLFAVVVAAVLALAAGSALAAGALVDINAADQKTLESLPGVGECVPVSKPYKLVGRELKEETTVVDLGDGVRIGGKELAIIAGPCAIESEKHALDTAERLSTIAAVRGVPFIYKSSYDKANRSSVHSYRGPGLVEGLRILQKVKDETGLAVLSDVHAVSEVAPAAAVLDVLQSSRKEGMIPLERCLADLVRAAGLGSEAERLILGGNAARLLQWEI